MTPRRWLSTPSLLRPNENCGARTVYTANVGEATTVDIALIPADEVTVADNGTVTFGDHEGTAMQADDGLADRRPRSSGRRQHGMGGRGITEPELTDRDGCVDTSIG